MLATVVQLWYKQRSIRRRNRKQSITITDEEHNQLLLNGSQTPQHDLMPRNALHPQHHMNATQLVDRNTRKDVNSNLLDGQRELNTSGKRSIDNSFDQDSLAAAFSTPLMQRRCSELAAAVTFHHFRHSPQPPTPIPASLATGIQPGTSAFTCPYPIKMIDDHHRTLISSSPNVASLTIPVLSTTGPVATPEPFVPTPDCRQGNVF